MDQTCTSDEMAALLGVSTRTVRELAAKKRLVRTGHGRFDMPASVATYCAHLREVASGNTASPDLTAERTRLAKEQADRISIENERSRGTLIVAEEAGARWADEIVKLRARLLAVPGQVALVIPQLSAFELQQVDRVLREAMSDVAGEEDASAE